MEKCKNCIHERICKIWGSQECQNASCYVDDCFEPKNKWISVKKQLPKLRHAVLVWCPEYKNHYMACLQEDGVTWCIFGSSNTLYETVTHWQEITAEPSKKAVGHRRARNLLRKR